MKRCWAIVTLVLLAIWLPASSHALLECAGFIHDARDAGPQHQDGSEHSPDHDLADGVCRFAATDTQNHIDQLAAVLPALVWLHEWLDHAQSVVRGEQLGADPPGTAPPDLPVAWQFSFRTALFGRAPSFLA